MLNRDQIIKEAYHRCMEEMYLKAQPSADFKQLVKDVKDGNVEDSKENPIYDRYYLSVEEYDHIKDKYMKAYRLNEEWSSNIEVLEEYLKNGGSKDKYIEAHEDEYGYHPGYRGYEKVAPIKEQIKDIIVNIIGEGQVSNSIVEKITSVVMGTIKNCKDFYRFDREGSQFSVSIGLGSSPTSNKKTVEEYWRSHGMPDFKIEERNPLLLWEQDYYDDEFEEVMISEYGNNWKEYWDNKWQEELAKKAAEREKFKKKLEERFLKKDINE